VESKQKFKTQGWETQWDSGIECTFIAPFVNGRGFLLREQGRVLHPPQRDPDYITKGKKD
jgi:hypothetical protein